VKITESSSYVLITDELAQDLGIPAFRLPSIARFGVRYTWPSALATGSRRAKTPQAVECEASQSGPKGNVQPSEDI
jgi:hypothetical protein